ncbi:putative actin binding protein [Talaromyces proteolyticus]|uniref:tRNA N(3)-methylcytidine methyltransferase n=1 Tax=Talaromyces proteolyticus TaxID=1131652 RepID=A0AAD4KUA5_9EURO|nr:putative actin binding protein [Talaromyces proteolyticus]KAH8700149.1 putative actin binding protein [Talaromyces proteolyticus]
MPALPEDSDYMTIARLVQPPTVPARSTDDPEYNDKKRVDPFLFGQRFLEEGSDVFHHNAWDHVETDDDYKAYAELQYSKQRENPASDFHKNLYNSNPAKFWDRFYKNHNQNFFKNRKWLQQEFPILADVTKKDAGRKVVLEVGAGAGNTAFPLVANNENEELMVHACDYSKNAVKVMRESEHYNEKYVRADVWDVTAEGDDSLPPGLEENSVDIIILIFIMSALAPAQWNAALKNVHRLLKPGGDVLFRDYGRGDLAQVRFRKERYLDENFYVRGDGTRVYFFDIEELRHIWTDWTPENGLNLSGINEDTQDRDEQAEVSSGRSQGAFEILNLGKDQRLLVNRQKRLKMYRCWLQARIRKRVPLNKLDVIPERLAKEVEKNV